VSEALAGLSERDLDTRLPGKWSVREIVHHLSDSEMVASARLRRIVAEDRPGIRRRIWAGTRVVYSTTGPSRTRSNCSGSFGSPPLRFWIA